MVVKSGPARCLDIAERLYISHHKSKLQRAVHRFKRDKYNQKHAKSYHWRKEYSRQERESISIGSRQDDEQRIDRKDQNAGQRWSWDPRGKGKAAGMLMRGTADSYAERG